ETSCRVARLLRSPLLRMQQVDVSAARDVERMSARTNQSPLLADQCHMTVADGTEEHTANVGAWPTAAARPAALYPQTARRCAGCRRSYRPAGKIATPHTRAL